MTALLVVAVVALGATVALLAVALVRSRAEVRALAEEAARLAAEVDPDAPWHPPVEVIAVAIEDHVTLAATRSPLAKPLGRVAPGLLRGVVHREVVAQLRAELAAQGVEADVRVRRVVGDGSPPGERREARS